VAACFGARLGPEPSGVGNTTRSPQILAEGLDEKKGISQCCTYQLDVGVGRRSPGNRGDGALDERRI